jgi:membrane protein DedA with SNARE-associated domain
MARTLAASRPAQTSEDGYEAHRTLLLGAAAMRGLLGIIAIPLAPFLYREHAGVLVLLRPSKEVLLLAGFLVRRGDASFPAVVTAALPLLLGGVWVGFALGRAYADSIDTNGLPRIAQRLLPPRRVDEMKEVLAERGPIVVFLGRLAAFPSSVLAAAAGASNVSTREFLIADTAGALLSLGVLLSAGYLLGEAYEDAGPWVAIVGAVVLAAVVVVLGRALLRPSGRRRR